MTAVVSADAVSVLRMDISGELIGGIGKNFDGNFLRKGVVSLVSSLGDKAGKLGKLRRSANRLDVLIYNWIGGNLADRGAVVGGVQFRPGLDHLAGRCTAPAGWEWLPGGRWHDGRYSRSPFACRRN